MAEQRKADYQSREMYLGVSLINLEFNVSSKDKGPDINDFKEISGILYSRATPFSTDIGQDYFFIHNLHALNPIPYGWLKSGSVASLDGEFINITKW